MTCMAMFESGSQTGMVDSRANRSSIRQGQTQAQCACIAADHSSLVLVGWTLHCAAGIGLISATEASGSAVLLVPVTNSNCLSQ
jgi:hypothetical protein